VNVAEEHRSKRSIGARGAKEHAGVLLFSSCSLAPFSWD
jgi:hypothetical protein